jgi:hypothetical protein
MAVVRGRVAVVVVVVVVAVASVDLVETRRNGVARLCRASGGKLRGNLHRFVEASSDRDRRER